jgi:hypothetical protein
MSPGKRNVVALVLIVLIGISPFISVVIAGLVASAYGCRLDEAGVYPCVIVGHDFGGLLGAMGVLGWAGLVTMPAALAVLGLWGAASLLRLARKR